MPVTPPYMMGRHTEETFDMIGLFMQCVAGPAVDIFGYTSTGHSITLHITGYTPRYMCKVPLGYQPDEFIDLLKAALDTEYTFSTTILTNDRHFSFGRKDTFIIIEHRKPYTLGESIPIVLDTYKTCLEKAHMLAEDDGTVLPFQLEESPLRYSENVSLNKYAYYLMIRSGLSLIGHLRLSNYEVSDNISTKTKLYVRVHIDDIEQSPDDVNLLKYGMTASYDIETDNLDPMSRKISDMRADPIITIGVAFYRFLSRMPLLSVGFYYAKTPSNPLDNVLLIRCIDEKEMLHAFVQLLDIMGTDVIESFNGEAFDNRYVYGRAELYGLQESISETLSRYKNIASYQRNLRVGFTYQGTYKGDGIIKTGLSRFVTTQRASFDTRLYFQAKYPKEFGETGSLNDMLLYFGVIDPTTGEVMGKSGLSIPEMYAYWSIATEDTVESRAKMTDIIKYCVQDCRCTHMLSLEQGVFYDLFEKAVVSYTTFNDSMHRADSVRVNNTCAAYAIKHGFAFMDVAPTPEFAPEWNFDRHILGGEVKSLRPGHHKGISAADYKSQYPAQMRGKNIDTSAKVPTIMIHFPAAFGLEIKSCRRIIDAYCDGHTPREVYTFARLDDPKEYIVEEFHAEWLKPGTDIICKVSTYYVQSPRGADGRPIEHYAIKEVMETDLSDRRDGVKIYIKKLKKELKVETVIERKIQLQNDIIRYDGKQGGIKVVMNSTYGVEGNSTFGLCDFQTAATITWCSRQLIGFLRRCISIQRFVLPMTMLEMAKGHIDTINKELDGDMKHATGGSVNDGIEHATGDMKHTTGDSACGVEHTTGDSACGDMKHTYGDSIEHANLITLNIDISLPSDGISTLVDRQTCLDMWPANRWFEINFGEYTGDAVYQDTDSNYFRNEGLVDTIYQKYADQLIDDPQRTGMFHAMKILNVYNTLMRTIVTDLIGKWPITLSFEGAFFIAYYWPQKKQYIGLVCPEDLKSMDDVIIGVSFDKYKQGTDIKLFLKSQNVKVTGAAIIRRETPAYIIKYLFDFLGQLLRPEPPLSLRKVGEEIMKQFMRDIITWDVSYVSRKQAYNISRENDVTAIVAHLNRLADTCDTHYAKYYRSLIPPNFSRVRYIVANIMTKYYDPHGIRTTNIRSRLMLVSEEVPIYDSDGRITLTHPLTGEDLDIKYYYTRLAAALSSFLISEMYHNEFRMFISKDDKIVRTKGINFLKERVVLTLLEPHFTIPRNARDRQDTYNTNASSAFGIARLAPEHAKTVGGFMRELAKADPRLADYVDGAISKEKETICSNRDTPEMKETKRIMKGLSKDDAMKEAIECGKTVTAAKINYAQRYMTLLINLREVDAPLCDQICKARDSGNGLLGENATNELYRRLDPNTLTYEKLYEYTNYRDLFHMLYRKYVAACKVVKLQPT